MPLTRCSNDGVSGYKWGSSGKCYTGPNARKLAVKQGLAEVGGDSKKFKAELAKGDFALTTAEIEQICAELLPRANKYVEAVDEYLSAEAYVSKKERDEMSPEDFGDPKNKKYPVKDQAHLNAAFRLLGRASKGQQASIRKRLKEIAKRKGLVVPKADQGDDK